MLKAFYNSAEKLLDITENNDQSKKTKRFKNEEKDGVIGIDKAILVGDYYT